MLTYTYFTLPILPVRCKKTRYAALQKACGCGSLCYPMLLVSAALCELFRVRLVLATMIRPFRSSDEPQE